MKNKIQIALNIIAYTISIGMLLGTIYGYIAAYTDFARNYTFEVRVPYQNPFVIEPREQTIPKE